MMIELTTAERICLKEMAENIINLENILLSSDDYGKDLATYIKNLKMNFRKITKKDAYEWERVM